jgi:hypothetical protein
MLTRLVPGEYKISADTVHAGGYSYSPTIDDPSVSVEAGHRSKAVVSYYTVLPDTTKVLAAAAVLSVSGSAGEARAVTLDKRKLGFASLKPGDILMIGVTGVTPHGYIGRVTSAVQTKTQILASTEPATLYDAIPQGEFSFSEPLSEAEAGTGVIPSSMAGRTARTLKAQSVTGVFRGISQNIECGESGSIELNGSAGVSLDLAAHMKWGKRWPSWRHPSPIYVKQASIEVSGTENVQLAATAHAGASCTIASAKLAEVYFAPVDIGPVVVFPKLELDLHGNASVSADLSASVGQSLTADAGVNYDNGDYSLIHTADSNFTWDPPTPNLAGNVNAGVTAKVSFSVYDVAGPYVTLDPSLGLDVNPLATTPDPWWALTGYLDAGVGLSGPGFNWSDPNLISYSEVLDQGVRDTAPPTETGIDSYPKVFYAGTPDQPGDPYEARLVSGEPGAVQGTWNGFWGGKPALFSDFQWELCTSAWLVDEKIDGPLQCFDIPSGNVPVLPISGIHTDYGAEEPPGSLGRSPASVFAAFGTPAPGDVGATVKINEWDNADGTHTEIWRYVYGVPGLFLSYTVTSDAGTEQLFESALSCPWGVFVCQ